MSLRVIANQFIDKQMAMKVTGKSEMQVKLVMAIRILPFCLKGSRVSMTSETQT